MSRIRAFSENIKKFEKYFKYIKVQVISKK